MYSKPMIVRPDCNQNRSEAQQCLKPKQTKPGELAVLPLKSDTASQRSDLAVKQAPSHRPQQQQTKREGRAILPTKSHTKIMLDSCRPQQTRELDEGTAHRPVTESFQLVMPPQDTSPKENAARATLVV
jgi:hypothetical protein